MTGKSGYLPNISGDFTYYKNYAINSLASKNYKAAASGLDDLNRCLGDDYTVTISTKLYDEAMNKETVYLCNYCTVEEKKVINKDEENEYIKTIQVPARISTSNIKVCDLLLPLIDSVVQNSKTEKVWYCPECKKENKMNETTQVIPERQKPFSLKVVPENPIRLSGLGSRLGFNEIFENWFYVFLGEITSQEVAYRTEWTSQHDGADMDEAYKDKGDLPEKR